MEPDNVRREYWQEQCVCLEIGHDIRLATCSSAEELAACQNDELNFRMASIAPHCEPSAESASVPLAECRICHEEEDLSMLETPCDCSGTLKYAHRSCVQRWCDEKGDTVCEICLQPYKHGYRVSASECRSGNVTLHISDAWGTELQDPRILALAAAPRHLLGSDYREFNAAVNSSTAVCYRSVALVFMALLLLRHVTAMAAATGNEDAFMFVLIFLLRIAGFLLPCYILIRAINTLQQGQQEQDVSITAAELSLMLQARRSQGVRLALFPAAAPGVQ